MSLGGFVSGALGGLAAGGPLGAAAGGVAGLLSGDSDQRQRVTMRRRPFSQNEQEILAALEEQYPDLIAQLSPDARAQVAQRYASMLRERGQANVQRVFDEQERKLDLGMARTGGSLGSIDLYRRGELARAEGEALSEVDSSAMLGGEQIASNRFREALAGMGEIRGGMGTLHGLRTTGQETTTSSNPMAGGASLLGWAAMSDDSYLSHLGDEWFD